MNRCKCILGYKVPEGSIEFIDDLFYHFDYVPPMGEKPQLYRVFCVDTQHHVNLDIKHFGKHFKKY
ncbi:MAG: hypothetical protein U0T82_01860 [Bacteroidales bacterium]